MKDGAAFIQSEAAGVFTEVLGNGAAQGVELLNQTFHFGQFSLGPLRNDKQGSRLQKAQAGHAGAGGGGHTGDTGDTLP